MLKERNVSISLLKTLACILIVVLHVIENSEREGIQLFIYLTGTYGIPLFFMVNGYLLYNREFTGKYIGHKILKVVEFVALWGATLGLLDSIVKRRFLIIDTVVNTFAGRGRLYHLWFMTALIFVYLGIFIITRIVARLSHAKLQDTLNKKTAVIIFISLSVIYFLSVGLFLNGYPEIRDLTWTPLRIVTSYSYFFLGMLINKFYDTVKKINSAVLIIGLVFCYIGTCLESVLLKMYWASSFYDSIFVSMGCCSIFILCLRCRNSMEKYSSFINTVSSLTIGIWILHPFVWNFVRKILRFMSLQISLPIRLIALPMIVAICAMSTFIAMKIPYIKKYFIF